MGTVTIAPASITVVIACGSTPPPSALFNPMDRTALSDTLGKSASGDTLGKNAGTG